MIIVLDNAIKYTAENDKIQIKTCSKDGKCVIEVIDTGTGISKEAANHVFIDSTEKTKHVQEKQREQDLYYQ